MQLTDRTIGLVVAAGSGERMGAPKQFLELTPKVRLVDRAVATITTLVGTLVVVLPPDATAAPDWQHTCTGGPSRIASVAAGLAAARREAPSADLVLVHDAAHCLASRSLSAAVLSAVADGADAAVPFWEVPDVVKRRGDDRRLGTVGRSGLGLAQVPMAFTVEALESAHGHPGAADAVEETTILESMGRNVVAVSGEVTNIHVVDHASLHLARLIASSGV